MYYCETGEYSQMKQNLCVHNCLLTNTEQIKRRGVLVMSVRYKSIHCYYKYNPDPAIPMILVLYSSTSWKEN